MMQRESPEFKRKFCSDGWTETFCGVGIENHHRRSEFATREKNGNLDTIYRHRLE